MSHRRRLGYPALRFPAPHERRQLVAGVQPGNTHERQEGLWRDPARHSRVRPLQLARRQGPAPCRVPGDQLVREELEYVYQARDHDNIQDQMQALWTAYFKAHLSQAQTFAQLWIVGRLELYYRYRTALPFPYEYYNLFAATTFGGNVITTDFFSLPTYYTTFTPLNPFTTPTIKELV